MNNIILWKIILVLMIFFTCLFILAYLIAKKRLKWRYILAFSLVIISILMIRYRVNNKIFFDFKNGLKEKYSYISNITVTDIDPHCYLDVYLKSKNYRYGEVEPILIEIMLALSDETIYNYFEQRHNKNANGEFYFLGIDFRDKGNNNDLLYRYRSHKVNNQFIKWRLEGSEIEYDLHDYLYE